MRRTSLLALLLTLLLTLAACAAPASEPAGDAGAAADTAADAAASAPSEPVYGGTLTVALDGEIDTIDPHVSVTIVGFQVYTQIFEGLVEATPTLDNVVPLLAESWEQTDDVTYVFTLRQGITFHDGSDFTAEDVVYSYDRVMSEDFGSPRRADLLPIESVTAVDDYTVEFKLTQPFAPFLTKLEVLRIVPADPENDPATNPIGTGPFAFVEWITGQRIELVKNENYWQEGRPYLDGVVFRPIAEPSTRVVELQTGSVDLLNSVPSKDVATLEADPNIDVYRVMGVVRDHIGFNMESPIFADNPNLRKAIGWAINREAIVEAIMFGYAVPAQIAIPSTHWAYNPAVEGAFGYDLAKAKEYYDASDPKPESITVKVSPTYPDQVKMAELLQQDLAQIGLDLQIEQLEWSTWIQQVVSEGNYEVEIVLISGGNDPDDFFYQWHRTGEVFNIQRYSDPDMDQMLADARIATDQETRRDLYYQIQEKLIEDAPMIHIIYRESIIAATARLQDFTMTGRYDMNFRDVWLTE